MEGGTEPREWVVRRLERVLAESSTNVRLADYRKITLEGHAKCAFCDRFVTGEAWQFHARHVTGPPGIVYHVCLDCAAAPLELR